MHEDHRALRYIRAKVPPGQPQVAATCVKADLLIGKARLAARAPDSVALGRGEAFCHDYGLAADGRTATFAQGEGLEETDHRLLLGPLDELLGV